MTAVSDTHMDHKAPVSSLPVQTGDVKAKLNGHGHGVISAVADVPTPPPTISPTFHLPHDPTYPLYTPSAPSSRTSFAFDTMPSALAAFARGEFLVVMDDENRENEGDLIIAAQFVTTEKLAWMIKRTSGYICIALPPSRLSTLNIPLMLPTNTERHRTAYTTTVDYTHGTTTGISAHDRALTIRALVRPDARPEEFMRPGHMVPLRACEGGVLERRGHTEAGVDLCVLAGLAGRYDGGAGVGGEEGEGEKGIAGGVLCELVNDDVEGSMMRRDQCRAFADQWGLKMISVEMIVEWRRKLEGLDA